MEIERNGKQYEWKMERLESETCEIKSDGKITDRKWVKGDWKESKLEGGKNGTSGKWNEFKIEPVNEIETSDKWNKWSW